MKHAYYNEIKLFVLDKNTLGVRIPDDNDTYTIVINPCNNGTNILNGVLYSWYDSYDIINLINNYYFSTRFMNSLVNDCTR